MKPNPWKEIWRDLRVILSDVFIFLAMAAAPQPEREDLARFALPYYDKQQQAYRAWKAARGHR